MRFWRRPTQSEQNIERLLSAYVEQGTFSGAVCVMQAGDVEFRFVRGPGAAITGIDMDSVRLKAACAKACASGRVRPAAANPTHG